jgi:alpha-ketoglutarate-dependent taurine dioxygenase
MTTWPEGARGLRADELAAPRALDRFPLVFDAPATRDLAAAIAPHAAALRRSLDEHGALLFRGGEAGTPEAFAAAIAALGLNSSRDYPFGVSPRPAISGAVFKSTEYTKLLVVPPHNEMAYARYRPAWIAFACAIAPQRYGETPIFDCAKALAALPADLRARLADTTMRYVRHIRHKRALLVFERTIAETFGTTDRAAIEAQCRELDVRPSWIGDRFLRAETLLPAVIRHPRTGHACLNAQFIGPEGLLAGMRRVRERYARPVLWLFERYIRKEFRKPVVHYRSGPAEGPDFSDAEIRAILEAVFDHGTMFRWHRGDVIVLDNIRVSHGRMNVKGPRLILTSLGDMYDTLAMRRATAAELRAA